MAQARSEYDGPELLLGSASLFNGALFRASTLAAIGVPDLRLFIPRRRGGDAPPADRSGLPLGTCLDAATRTPADQIQADRCTCTPNIPTLGSGSTYRNRGYVLSPTRHHFYWPMARFGWFFLVRPAATLKACGGVVQLRHLGRREKFGKPGGSA